MGEARDARPTPSRVVRMARVSVSAAMIFILPLQAGQTVTSNWKRNRSRPCVLQVGEG